jgi:hypothetical protein
MFEADPSDDARSSMGDEVEPVSVRVHRGKKGFYQIQNEWCQLVDMLEYRHLFHLCQWHQSYIETLDDEESVFFVLMYRNERLIAIFPFEKREKRVFGIKCSLLQIPHDEDMDIVDFICDETENDEDLIDLLVRSLKTKLGFSWTGIVYPNVLDESSIKRSLKKTGYELIVSEKTEGCFYLQCKSYEEITDNLSRKFRTNLKRAKKSLSRLGDIVLFSTSTKSDMQWALRELIRLESSGWKGKAGTAIKDNTQGMTFYANLVENFSENGGCEINLLRINGSSIAASLDLRVDRTVYGIKLGYDENYSKFSPGVIMLDELLKKYCNDCSVDTMNLMSGEKWMAKWKPSSFDMFRVMIFQKSVIGRLLYHAYRNEHLMRAYREYSRRWTNLP